MKWRTTAAVLTIVMISAQREVFIRFMPNRSPEPTRSTHFLRIYTGCTAWRVTPGSGSTIGRLGISLATRSTQLGLRAVFIKYFAVDHGSRRPSELPVLSDIGPLFPIPRLTTSDLESCDNIPGPQSGHNPTARFLSVCA